MIVVDHLLQKLADALALLDERIGRLEQKHRLGDFLVGAPPNGAMHTIDPDAAAVEPAPEKVQQGREAFQRLKSGH